MEALSPAQRRSLHASIVDMLTANGEPAPEALPSVVRHALAAGDTDLIGRYSVDAARAALDANAPEEALRIVDEALVVVAEPAQRVKLLCMRDDALVALNRTAERLEAITELAALVQAVGDKTAEFDVQLRRAAALRGDKRYDAAADVARRVRAQAEEDTDAQVELAACLELGQDLLRAPLGEGYTPTPFEADLEGGQEAFERARVLATQLGLDERLAQALRELGAINLAHVRAWFVELVRQGGQFPYVARVAAGEPMDQIEQEMPIHDQVLEAEKQLTQALELFEKIGDRRGSMATIVSLAYLHWGPELHLGTNPAQRFEGIRRARDSDGDARPGQRQREQAEGQMLYGAHVFARAKLIPDMAMERGELAYQRARSLGDSDARVLVGDRLTHVHLGAGRRRRGAALARSGGRSSCRDSQRRTGRVRWRRPAR